MLEDSRQLVKQFASSTHEAIENEIISQKFNKINDSNFEKIKNSISDSQVKFENFSQLDMKQKLYQLQNINSNTNKIQNVGNNIQQSTSNPIQTLITQLQSLQDLKSKVTPNPNQQQSMLTVLALLLAQQKESQSQKIQLPTQQISGQNQEQFGMPIAQLLFQNYCQSQLMNQQQNNFQQDKLSLFNLNEASRKISKMTKNKGKKINFCHPDRQHYAKNMCKNCYHKYGRSKKPWACDHVNQQLYAKGLCQNCYINQYNHEKKFNENNSNQNLESPQQNFITDNLQQQNQQQ